jgi:hypothetical protein
MFAALFASLHVQGAHLTYAKTVDLLQVLPYLELHSLQRVSGRGKGGASGLLCVFGGGGGWYSLQRVRGRGTERV